MQYHLSFKERNQQALFQACPGQAEAKGPGRGYGGKAAGVRRRWGGRQGGREPGPVRDKGTF